MTHVTMIRGYIYMGVKVRYVIVGSPAIAPKIIILAAREIPLKIVRPKRKIQPPKIMNRQ